MPRRCSKRADKEEKVVKPRFLKARLSEDDHRQMHRIAAERGIKISRLTRTILQAHLKGIPVRLPHPRGITDELVHQLARIGNNLNQLAHQANIGYVAVPMQEIRSCIDAINQKVAQL
ncbi:MobC family plasmid mobilization relaxosome protein [Filomicrobium sp.]|uniref:MobC family plasmid mobilization relaxosome protein n=1 Tax=Filomicrobium sp. TaxID=2024831 RepID=UPI0025890437|nr:MobC family plasmid mobilization relaxosome protein [Filomicrobium sp.]MCV0370427.1 MobC family plasmid mobilization relaxosome protein [Filomicrobium sp.]